MQVSSNAQANLEALIAAFQGVEGNQLSAEGVTDISVVNNGDTNLVITFNMTVNGETVPVTFSLSPELEEPDGVADELALETLLSRLDSLSLSEMTSTQAVSFMNAVIEKAADRIRTEGMKSTVGTRNLTLFNLLEVLTLICDVAQEIKRTSKNIKASDNEMQAQAYERQATKTEAMAEVAKEMGTTYMIVSVCMLAVSALVSIGAGVVGAVKGSLAGTKASGVESDMSSKIMNSSGEVDMNALTTFTGKRAGGSIGTERVNAIKSDFADNPGIANAKSDYQTAVNTQAAKARNLETKQGELAQLKENAGEHPTDEQQQAIDAKQGEVDAAQQQLDDAKTATAEAKQEFVDSVMAVKGKYDSAYVNSTDAERGAKQDEMVVANELAMKTLKGTEVTVTDGEDVQSQQTILNSTDCGKIVASAAKAHRANLKDENHYILSALASGGTFIGQLGQTLNQGLQSKVSYQAQLDGADAQREQAEASRKQKDYDESKALEEASQEMINAARQTMQKSYESQHEAAKEIFG